MNESINQSGNQKYTMPTEYNKFKNNMVY